MASCMGVLRRPISLFTSSCSFIYSALCSCQNTHASNATLHNTHTHKHTHTETPTHALTHTHAHRIHLWASNCRFMIGHHDTSQQKSNNMVTRILTTLRFWPGRVKTPHFLLFCKTAFSALHDETLEAPFFQLAGGCSRSFWSVMAINPLVDSIPELSIYGRASAVLHLTGTKFLQVIPK